MPRGLYGPGWALKTRADISGDRESNPWSFAVGELDPSGFERSPQRGFVGHCHGDLSVRDLGAPDRCHSDFGRFCEIERAPPKQSTSRAHLRARNFADHLDLIYIM